MKVFKYLFACLCVFCLFMAYGGFGAIETGNIGFWYVWIVFIWIGAAYGCGKIATRF